MFRHLKHCFKMYVICWGCTLKKIKPWMSKEPFSRKGGTLRLQLSRMRQTFPFSEKKTSRFKRNFYTPHIRGG